jgi:hypothetical protein
MALLRVCGPGICEVDGVSEIGISEEGADEMRALDLGAFLDTILGLPSAENYILLVVDPPTSGVQAYGPYTQVAVRDAATAMRKQLRADGVDGVSVHVLALHSPEP